jgi:ATP-dependent Clp protease ATP-binding subunit ClpC
MDSDLAKLLADARGGNTDAFGRLVEQLRQRAAKDPHAFVEAAASGEEVLQRAVIEAARNLIGPEVQTALQRIAAEATAAVKQNLAYALTDAPRWPMGELALALLRDGEDNVRQSAVWCVHARPELHAALIERLTSELTGWVRAEVANALADTTLPTALPVLVHQLATDADGSVQQSAAYAADRQIARLRVWPANLPRPEPDLLAEARRRLPNLTGNFPALGRWLADELIAYVDVEQLAGFGTVLTRPNEVASLARACNVDAVLASVLAVLKGEAPRAAVLIGETGTGKTAIVHELIHRLRADPAGPWHVLRLSPPEWLADTRYTGEWETRVRNIVAACRPPRRVLVYVPNLEELVWMGAWSKSEANVASALAPYIERGEVTILGESTAEGYRKGLGSRGPLRRLFTVIEVPEATPKETRAILHAVAAEAGADVPEPVVERLMDLADYYSTGTAQPGRAVGLLRRVLAATQGKGGPIADRDILHTISTSTGVPVAFLDDSVALDRAELRSFFEARVMGQPEAVDAVLDLVTLVKAGLTDPHKPFGVLLFVGPTGVGKTELARALAECLFGDAARMVRLDMSEFATYEAFERLIGQGHRSSEPGLLTAAVREKPFAVLLFDEIEKAHPNIYNLCLQIFDAGRLTDTQGRTADFRRTIIILTSNVGTGNAPLGSVGFGQRGAAPSAPDRETTLRELSRWFRPEFLNRLDRIVTFRPLSEETAEKIARREVARVLERGGITRRRLALDVAPEVLPLLLRDGYSPVFGARPLKRTVERMVLLPVARAVAAGEVPPGSLLRLVARGQRIDIEVSPPETPEAAKPTAAPRRVPAAARAGALLEKVRALHTRAEALRGRKSELLALSAAPGFWDEPTAARRLLDEVYRIDSVLAALETLENRARIEAEKAERRKPSDRDGPRVEEKLDTLEGEARHVEFLLHCSEPRQLCDALVTVRLVASHGGELASVPLLARMYQALAGRRGWEVDVLDDRKGGEPAEDTITLAVAGAGAFALLAAETGIHQVARGRSEVRGGKRRAAEREVVHVEVLPTPLGDAVFAADELRVETRSLTKTAGRLLRQLKHEVRLFHVPSMTAVRAWTDGTKAEAVDKVKVLLRARLDATAAHEGERPQRPPVVRRYTLGPTTLVRDLRSGRSTGRLDQVLEGHLEAFLRPG